MSEGPVCGIERIGDGGWVVDCHEAIEEATDENDEVLSIFIAAFGSVLECYECGSLYIF